MLYALGLHNDRLTTLHENYISKKDALLASVHKERENTNNESEDACTFLQTVIFDMNCRNQTKNMTSCSVSGAKQDELRNQVSTVQYSNNVQHFVKLRSRPKCCYSIQCNV